MAGARLLCSGGALSFCTCAQPAPGSGCGCLSSTPVQSQKHFTTRQLNASFHPQKRGVCCKPATFPSSHSPLSRSTVCLKSSPLRRDYWRADFFSPSFPPISSPCLHYLWSGRFFLSTAPAAGWKLAGRHVLFSPSKVQMRLWRCDTEGKPWEAAAATSHTVQPPSVQNKALLWKASLDSEEGPLRVAAGTRFSKPPS